MADGIMIELDDIKEGMKLLRPLYDINTGKLLLSKGVVLNERVIEQLKLRYKNAVGKLYVECSAKRRENTDYDYSVKHILGGMHQGLLKLQGMISAVENVSALISEDGHLKDCLNTIYAYDTHVLLHSLSSGVIVGNFLDVLTVKDQNAIKLALLHDIGKIKIPIGIINKPSNLTNDEYKVVKEHSRIGYYELKNSTSYKDLDGVLQHHERWDGSGYPNGLKGESISQNGRIFALIDTFDALISARSYRRPARLEDAFTYIEQKSGVLYDPKLVKEFLTSYRMKMASSGQ